LIPRYPHQSIASLNTLALSLGVSKSELSYLMTNSDDFFYIANEIKKPDGSLRITYDVKPKLKIIHERISNSFLKKVKYPSFLHGSLKGKDYLSNIKQHTNKKIVISEDASNFFPSITKKVIHEIWVGVFGFSNDVANCLATLVTLNGTLVQGAKPSSYLANLVLWKREANLFRELQLKGCEYTRYVDDITVSSNHNLSKNEIAYIVGKVYSMLKTIKVKPNRSKHQVMLNQNKQQVHKVNVNRKNPTLSKKVRSNIKSSVFECEKNHLHTSKSSEYKSLYNRSMGRVNNMKRMHPGEANKLIARLHQVKPN